MHHIWDILFRAAFNLNKENKSSDQYMYNKKKIPAAAKCLPKSQSTEPYGQIKWKKQHSFVKLNVIIC